MSSIPIANSGHHTVIRVVGCEPNVEQGPDATNGKASVQQDQRTKSSSPMEAMRRKVASLDSCSQRPSRTPPRKDDSEASSQGTDTFQEKTSHAGRPRACSADSANGRASLETSVGDENGVRDEEIVRDAEQCEPAWHRTRQVRIQQGVSVRSMARRMGIDAKTYRRLENPNTDLTLSELASVQRALDVPLADLLVDRDGLSRPVAERAKLLKAMKTAVAIRDSKSNSRISRMANMLCEQLIDLMPELKEVGGWPKFGARRGSNALGKALCQPIDMSALRGQD